MSMWMDMCSSFICDYNATLHKNNMLQMLHHQAVVSTYLYVIVIPVVQPQACIVFYCTVGLDMWIGTT